MIINDRTMRFVTMRFVTLRFVNMRIGTSY